MVSGTETWCICGNGECSGTFITLGTNLQRKIETGAVLVYRANNEQGFEMHISGEPKREVIDLEGIQLVRVKSTEAKESKNEDEIEEEFLPGFHFHLNLLEEQY